MSLSHYFRKFNFFKKAHAGYCQTCGASYKKPTWNCSTCMKRVGEQEIIKARIAQPLRKELPRENKDYLVQISSGKTKKIRGV